jgi:mannosyl-oligosaccharide alpha-1,3-glucosidase
VIKLSPFEIDFYQNEVKVVTVNSNGLMKFEELRTKPSTPDPNEDEEAWEEEFNGGIDSKKNGPEGVALDFTFPESEILFGIPEHADSFSLQVTKGSEPYRLYTLDVPGYTIGSREALYGSIPVIYGHGPKQTAGIFWHNSADTFIDIHDNKNAHFMSEVGIIDVFVLLGPKPHDTFKQYTKLTGVANLPQLFTLAYHQSRWNYMTQEDLLDVVSKFKQNEIPMDTMWLDIEYTNGKRYFTWNTTAFPQPVEMMQNLKEQGKRLTFIIDPHIAKDEGYFFYNENKNRGFYVKDAAGNDYEGSCWPGMSSYVDFFNPEARRFYADQYLLENFPDNSIETGIWNDMNEPAVFDVPEKTMPRDNIHYGGWEHRALHNMYAFMQVKGTHDGLMRRSNGGLRPFILTRAFFAGSQR